MRPSDWSTPYVPEDLEGLLHPLEDLNPHHANARDGDVGAIIESIETNGLYRPIVVNRGNQTGRPNEILAGNHTHEAMRLLETDRIPVTWVDVDETTATRILLVDNRSNDLATYRDDELAELLVGLSDGHGADALKGTGFDGDDLDDLLLMLEPPSLDDLAADYEPPDEDTNDVTINLKVAPETKAAWTTWAEAYETDTAALNAALNKAAAAP